MHAFYHLIFFFLMLFFGQPAWVYLCYYTASFLRVLFIQQCNYTTCWF